MFWNSPAIPVNALRQILAVRESFCSNFDNHQYGTNANQQFKMFMVLLVSFHVPFAQKTSNNELNEHNVVVVANFCRVFFVGVQLADFSAI